MGKATRFTLLFLPAALFVTTLLGQDLSKGVYWLTYDVKTHGPLKLCPQRAVACNCIKWDPNTNFFRSGSLIRVEVLNGKFRSTFNVAVKGITLTDFVPQIRGVSSSPGAGQPNSTKQPASAEGAVVPLVPPPPPPPETDLQKAYDQIVLSYDKAEAEVGALEVYLGPAPTTVKPKCEPRITGSPTGSAGGILNFVTTLDADAAFCDSRPDVPFTNEAAFDDLTDRADRLIQSIALFNATIPSKADIDAKVSVADDDFNAFSQLATRFVDPTTHFDNIPNRQVMDLALNDVREKQSELTQRVQWIRSAGDKIATDIQKINNEMATAFAYINALYGNSEAPEPFDLPIGQYSSNYAAQFSIYEVPQTVAYAVTVAKSPTSGGSADAQHPVDAPGNQPSSVVNPFSDPNNHPSFNSHPVSFVRSAFKTPLSATSFSMSPEALKAGVTKPTPTDKSDQPAPTQGKVIYTSGNYDVHNFYQGNLVAGFFVSSLRNRQYGITNNGQSSSTSNLTYVTVIGPVSRPQYHAFVGLDLYFGQRDRYPPGGVFVADTAGPPRVYGPKWYAKSFVPALQIGYGVDTLNNYLLGADWETPIGLNISSGVHIGQETFLQPGIVAGLTQLPSGATAAPTTNQTEYGWYGSAGFDLNIMKALIGSLFGANSNGSKTGQ